MTKKTKMTATVAAVILMGASTTLFSHCQIPCGIYDDAMRVQMIEEHIKTIQKAMIEIGQLESAGDKNYNQLVRWVSNKEKHADELTETVTQYFMTQRISPADPSNEQAYQAYVNKLTLLHKLMIDSMKCKQATDLENVAKLKETLALFKTAYFGESDSSAQHTH